MATSFMERHFNFLAAESNGNGGSGPVKPRIRTEAGIVLVVTLVLVITGAIGVAAFLSMIKGQLRFVELQSHSTKAFYAAEAGLEKAMQLLKDDFYYTPQGTEPSWADDKLYTETGYIDLTRGGQITLPRCLDLNDPDYINDFYPLVGETDYNFDGYGTHKSTYRLDVSNVEGWTDRVWVKTTGRYYRRNETADGFVLESERRTLALVEAREISVWNNAVFTGEGQAGGVINGNADIRGSVHILGTSLGSNDLAMELGGGGSVRNNYVGIPPVLGARIPSIEKTYGEETVDSLGAEVRIQHGKLSLSGASRVGEPDVPGNGVKETMDGVYITDGYGGDGVQNVYSDNGTNNSYDVEEVEMSFPRLSEPYQDYSSYLDYLRANALVISDPQKLNQLQDIVPTSAFNYSNSDGHISMDGNGHLTIDGIVVVEGNVNFDKIGSDKTIGYSGAGTIVSASNVSVKCNLITGAFNTFPKDDILGLMAADRMTFDSAQINAMGVFYAENKIVCNKQTSIAGAVCSNYLDMGSNVPSIYQVPEVVGYLPPGFPGDTRVWVIKRLTWGEF